MASLVAEAQQGGGSRSLPRGVAAALSTTRWRRFESSDGHAPALCADRRSSGSLKEACWPLDTAFAGAEQYIILLWKWRNYESYPWRANASAHVATKEFALQGVQSAVLSSGLGFKMPAVFRTGRLKDTHRPSLAKRVLAFGSWANKDEDVRVVGNTSETMNRTAMFSAGPTLGRISAASQASSVFAGAAGLPVKTPRYFSGSLAFQDPLDAELSLPAFHLLLSINGQERVATVQQRLDESVTLLAKSADHSQRAVSKLLTNAVHELLQSKSRSAEFLRTLWCDLHRLLARFVSLELSDAQFIITNLGEIYLVDPGASLTFRSHRAPPCAEVVTSEAGRSHGAPDRASDRASDLCWALHVVESQYAAAGQTLPPLSTSSTCAARV
jgi:hypothetical protein